MLSLLWQLRQSCVQAGMQTVTNRLDRSHEHNPSNVELYLCFEYAFVLYLGSGRSRAANCENEFALFCLTLHQHLEVYHLILI